MAKKMIGQRLKEKRLSQGLSQAAFALRHLNVSEKTYNGWELGKAMPSHWRSLHSVANVLGMDVGEIKKLVAAEMKAGTK